MLLALHIARLMLPAAAAAGVGLEGAGAGVDGTGAAVTGRGWVDGVLLTLLLLLRGPGEDWTRDGL